MNFVPARARLHIAMGMLVLGLCLFSNNGLLVANGPFCKINYLARAIVNDSDTQWMVFICLLAYFAAFIVVNARSNKTTLIIINPECWILVLIIISSVVYSFSYPSIEALVLLTGALLGQVAGFFIQKYELRGFVLGSVGLLASSSLWHLDVARNFYPGTRWTGLWDNPNIYGMLMGAGLTLATGSLVAELKLKALRPKAGDCAKANGREDSRYWLLRFFLFIATGMLGVGLFFSYSRGAWLGTTLGLLYLVQAHGKFTWRWFLPGFVLVGIVTGTFWHSTVSMDRWFVKRMDFSRASAQHRVAAWKAGFEIMRDHPLGIGWNNAVDMYAKHYSPPEGGAAALTMNSYLMVGTELGLPGLICFVGYVALCFKRGTRATLILPSPAECQEGNSPSHCGYLFPLHTSCRGAATVLLVAYWFDGGLFDLSTASVFWILLELGTTSQPGAAVKL